MKETPDPGSETPAVAALDPNHDETTEHDHEHESVALTTETTSAEQDATAADLTDEAPRPQLKIALKRRTIEAPPQAEPPPAEPPPVRDPIATDEPKVIPPPPPTPERIRLEDEPAAETAPPRLVLKSKAAVAPAADQTLGELFQLARHQLDQSARQVADITRLSPDFINAAESDRLAPIYCRHNLKLLARHYGIDETEVLRRYDDAAPTGGPALDPDVLLPKAERADSAGLSTGRSAPRGKAGIVVSWVLTGLIVIGVAVALTMMLRNRRQAAPLPVAAEQAAPTPIDDDQLERFIHPESLPFTELPVPVNP